MITLPAVLQKVMNSKDLNGLKPFAVLFRNKWVEEESASESESGYTGAGYVLDTLNPIDISHMIAKPNTLSMTLDVNEIAQYNANNVTLTLTDPENRFLEGAPGSYFPDGYQLYGSRVVLYYGLDNTNKTALFTGVIKDLPTHKPETYQVDLKLVSPLEMLKDIEAKDFSDKITGEELHYEHQDDDSHRVYSTAGTGVGGFDAVYADGEKLFEGVDYEVSQTNMLGVSAFVTIINDDYHNADITADYYTWKTNLTVEQIVEGLVGLAGYTQDKEDIRQVVWSTGVRNQPIDSTLFAGIGYYERAEHEYSFNWRPTYGGSWDKTTSGSCTNTLPVNWDYSFSISVNNESSGGGGTYGVTIIAIGDSYNSESITIDRTNMGAKGVNNGISVRIMFSRSVGLHGSYTKKVYIHQISGGNATLLYSYDTDSSGTSAISGALKITHRGNDVTVYKDGVQVASAEISTSMNYLWQGDYKSGSDSNVKDFWAYNQSWNIYDNNLRLCEGNITNPCFISNICDMTDAGDAWGEIAATLEGSATYFLNVYFSSDLTTWTSPETYNLNTTIARNERYLYYVLGVSSYPNTGFTITDPSTYYLASTLLLQLINLSGKTVLEALQDLALISGYEFGVNREGVFFFRPRVQSTTPAYTLGHDELLKVDTVKRNLGDFFTKLTLTFSTVPLEFYANSGDRPTPIDRYGVINKEIDKPEIVNYDNPELAQAIGPQLLEIYSALPNVIQATGKLNLALELGDIVNLKRNYPLTADKEASDYNKFERQDTYYRACKITGMNYNFSKRQITYTLRDVSNSNNSPLETEDLYEFVYDLPIKLGVK